MSYTPPADFDAAIPAVTPVISVGRVVPLAPGRGADLQVLVTAEDEGGSQVRAALANDSYPLGRLGAR